jgi:hypothetical protein
MSTSSEDPPITEQSLVSEPIRGCPGGLVQRSNAAPSSLPPPEQLLHLGISVELGPFPEFLGDWVALVGDAPGDPVVTSDGEQLYVLVVYLGAGMAQRHKCRTRDLQSTSSTEQATPNFINNIAHPEEDVGRGPRAKAEIIKLARSNELNLFVSLDYADQPDDLHRYPSACDNMFTLFMRRIRKQTGGVPWIEVMEYGDENYRLHHHVLLPTSIDTDLISAKWTYGTAVCRHLPDLDAIGSVAMYMGKQFNDNQSMRPRRNRYRASRKLDREKPIRLIGTRDEVETALIEMLPEGTNPRGWLSEHPYSAGGYTWNRPI